MIRSIIFWVIALLITAGSAIYQRLTGPTYPLTGKITLNERKIKYEFARSHAGTSDHEIKIETSDEIIGGFVEWKRYKTNDAWISIPMKYENGWLSAKIPNQPPAGKLEYRIILENSNQKIVIPENQNVIIRFRGDVPLMILIMHVLTMFIGMFLSTRTGLETFTKEANLKKFVYWTIGFLVVGGLILGPIVQKYAFGVYWTGWPFGHDLTDNKTAIMVIFWLFSAFALKKFNKPKYWVLTAAIVTLIVYLIPHSLLGSELDYSKMEETESTY